MLEEARRLDTHARRGAAGASRHLVHAHPSTRILSRVRVLWHAGAWHVHAGAAGLPRRRRHAARPAQPPAASINCGGRDPGHRVTSVAGRLAPRVRRSCWGSRRPSLTRRAAAARRRARASTPATLAGAVVRPNRSHTRAARACARARSLSPSFSCTLERLRCRDVLASDF